MKGGNSMGDFLDLAEISFNFQLFLQDRKSSEVKLNDKKEQIFFFVQMCRLVKCNT